MACLIASVGAAFACGPLASVAFAVPEAMPGATVTGTGKGFSNAHGGAPSAEPVVAHLDTRTGMVLWSDRPDLSGNISFSFPAPNTSPGDHVVIFTQTNADGVSASGTPAKAVLRILASPVTTTTTQPATTYTPGATVTTPPQTAPPTPEPAAPAPDSAPDSPVPDSTAPARAAAPRAAPARSPVTTAAATTTTAAAVTRIAAPVQAVEPATDAAPSPGTGQVALDAQETGFTSPNSDGGGAAPVVLALIVLVSMGTALGIRRFRSRTR